MKRSSDENVQAPSKSKIRRMDRDAVHVFCRLRPDVESPCVKLLSSTTLSLAAESKVSRKKCNYTIRHIFTSDSSREVFEHVGLPLLEDLINGKNGLLFTYGVTGSGKTFALTGDQSNAGIIPRCIDTIFNTIGDYQAQKYLIKPDGMNGFEVQSASEALEEQILTSKSSTKKLRSLKKNSGDGKAFYVNDGTKIPNFTENGRFAVFITYTEIYNNTVFDLLDESAGKDLQAKIIREDSQKNMYVNAVEVEVNSSTEAFELFYLGQKRKRMAHTVLNAESSRSHSIFNIRLVQLQVVQSTRGQPMVPDQNLLRIGQLSLVDLAGSERCSRTQHTGMRLREASNTNNSLMSLRTCLEILHENQLTGANRLVPYRGSRLTLLFKNYFEGGGQVRMIVCVNPSIEDYEENLQVLKFAEMAQDVKVPRSEAKYMPYRKTPTTKVKGMGSVQKSTTSSKAKKPPSFSFGPKIASASTSSASTSSAIVATPQRKDLHDHEFQQTPPLYRRGVSKPDRRRRSRSAGEVWLVHNAVPLRTFFQPATTKWKSITKLVKPKDLTKSKRNRYALIAQEAQADSEVATNLYKGDILPTRGGGAQVVFGEVETLTARPLTKNH